MLSDATKRSIYDQHGHAGIEAAARAAAVAASAAPRQFSDIFGDVFGDIFGSARRGGGRSQVYRGADLRYEVELDLARGGVRPHARDRPDQAGRVRDCATAAARPRAAHPMPCDTCGGSRPGARLAGLLHAAADLPALPRQRAHRAQSLRCLPRAGAGPPAQEARGQDSRRASTPAIACGWQARARPDATAARPAICTSRCRCANTRSSSATART